MRTILKTGMNNPMVRQAAADLASILFNEVGVPLAKSGARKAYKEISRRSHRRHH